MDEASLGFKVIHADDQLVVVHKEAGLLTTPAHGEAALVDLLERALDRQSFGRYRLAVVHRLDRQTSGLLVFARTPTAAAKLSKELARHAFEREYVAIVAGLVAVDGGSFAAKLDGKRAVTHFTVARRLADTTLVTVRLETGRRNQIRRHFADAGHPILGETRFYPELAKHPRWPHARLALQAQVLGLVHPVTRLVMRFSAEMPKEFVEFLS